MRVGGTGGGDDDLRDVIQTSLENSEYFFAQKIQDFNVARDDTPLSNMRKYDG